MSNVHGLFSNKNKDEEDNDDDDDNNRYVGGIGARGGGRYVRCFFSDLPSLCTESL